MNKRNGFKYLSQYFVNSKNLKKSQHRNTALLRSTQYDRVFTMHDYVEMYHTFFKRTSWTTVLHSHVMHNNINKRTWRSRIVAENKCCVAHKSNSNMIQISAHIQCNCFRTYLQPASESRGSSTFLQNIPWRRLSE